MEFQILKKSKKSRARAGVIKTPHGEVMTPVLVAVATQATIKTLTSEEVKAAGSQILICNTFHLHTKPGEKIVKAAGGLHRFMRWDQPLMTDSGGYQVFSLGFGKEIKMGKMVMRNEKLTIQAHHKPRSIRIMHDGVYFRSPVDGRELFLGPKESMRIQRDLGADIMFTFDECPPPTADRSYIEKSLERTHRWALQSVKAKSGKGKALFGIIQGGKYKDLRIKSAHYISSLPFEGFGIGGELGFDKKAMFTMIKWVTDELPEVKPRHLLGNGHLDDLREIFKSGVDTIDCIIPTHYARHGVAFVTAEQRRQYADLRGRKKISFESGREATFIRLDLSKSVFLKDKAPLDPQCACLVCQTYTRSYISHLYRAKEITAMRLLTFHNLYFWNTIVENIRKDILKGKV